MFDMIEAHSQLLPCLSRMSHALFSTEMTTLIMLCTKDLFVPKLRDPDDKIRELVCKRFLKLGTDLNILSQLDISSLKEIGERCRDRRVSPFFIHNLENQVSKV
jgi:hypothetical protein